MATLFQAGDAQAPFRAVQRAKVRVNGVTISSAAIAREVQHHACEQPLHAWRAAARGLALRELMLQEARRLALSPVPLVDEDDRRETEDEARIRQLIESQVRTPVADREACRRYYDANRSRFRSADLFEAAHILLPAQPGDREPLVVAKRDARVVLDQLAVRPDAFVELAAAYSACPSGKVSGSLGQISKGDTTPPFEAALLRLAPGETTREPVETRYGLHIIRLDRRVAGDVLPFEAVEARIGDYLAERSRRLATVQYLARLASGAEIEGVEMPTPADVGVF
jgi:peptidyl-prolyl cis-trans isomerase C